MALKTWTDGAADGNWATAGNWSPSAPGAADDVLIDRSSRNIIAGLATGISITSLTVTPGFGGSIGTAGSALTFTAITGLATLSGSGAFIKLGASGTIASTLISSSGTVYLTAGTFTNVYAKTPWEGEAAAILTNVYNVGGIGTIGYNATACTVLYNSAGTVNCGRSITTMTNNGTTRLQLAAAVTTANNNAGAVYMNSTGTITTYNGYDKSVFSAAGATQPTAAGSTITTANLFGTAKYALYSNGITQTIGTLNAFGRNDSEAPIDP